MDISWNLDIVYNITWALLAEVDRHNAAAEEAAGAAHAAAPFPPPYRDAVAGSVTTNATGAGRTLIRSILMPGLGTGTGALPFARFAAQFALAVKCFDEAVRKPQKWSNLDWPDVASVVQNLERTFTATEDE